MIQYSKCFLIVQLNPQVEPNARKIEEHRRKYERLRKERELKKAELERKQQAEAQVSVFFFYFCTNNCSFYYSLGGKTFSIFGSPIPVSCWKVSVYDA